MRPEKGALLLQARFIDELLAARPINVKSSLRREVQPYYHSKHQGAGTVPRMSLSDAT